MAALKYHPEAVALLRERPKFSAKAAEQLAKRESDLGINHKSFATEKRLECLSSAQSQLTLDGI
jgi:hypothetical protein